MTILVWMMVWLSNGAFPMFHLPSYVRIALMICAVLSYMLIYGIRPTVKKRNLEIAFLFIGLQGVTILLYGLSFNFDVNLILVVLLAVLTSSTIDDKNFVEAFQRGIFWIALISSILHLGGFVVQYTNYIPNVLLQATNSAKSFTFMGTFVLINRGPWSYYRNCGIFTEPGQFQIYLNIGLFIELFVKKVPSVKTLVVLVLGLVTCQSTNGFLVTMLLAAAYILNCLKGQSVLARRTRYIISFTIIMLSITLWLDFDNNSIMTEILEKLNGLRISNYSMSDSGTGLERRRAFDLAFQMFLSNPITGIGYLGQQNFLSSITAGNNQIIMTVSPLNWFARFGIIYGMLANIGYIRFYSRYVKNIFPKIIIVFAVLMLISGQAVNVDYITWFIVFHGLCDRSMFNAKELKPIETQGN